MFLTLFFYLSIISNAGGYNPPIKVVIRENHKVYTSYVKMDFNNINNFQIIGDSLGN